VSREVVLKGVGPSADEKEVHTDSGGSPWVQLHPVARVATSAIQKKQFFKSPALGLLSSIKGLFLYEAGFFCKLEGHSQMMMQSRACSLRISFANLLVNVAVLLKTLVEAGFHNKIRRRLIGGTDLACFAKGQQSAFLSDDKGRNPISVNLILLCNERVCLSEEAFRLDGGEILRC